MAGPAAASRRHGISGTAILRGESDLPTTKIIAPGRPVQHLFMLKAFPGRGKKGFTALRRRAMKDRSPGGQAARAPALGKGVIP